jgi:hypothetical protein
MVTFALHGYEGANPALQCGTLQAALDTRACLTNRRGAAAPRRVRRLAVQA